MYLLMTRMSAATPRLPTIFQRKTREPRFLLGYGSRAANLGDCLETLLRDDVGGTTELYIVAIRFELLGSNDLERVNKLCNRGVHSQHRKARGNSDPALIRLPSTRG